jgi:O-antigen ligase
MRERLLPWLLVLPALAFATPLSPLAEDPYPHLAGTGLALVLLAPLAVSVLASGTSTPRAWPFVLALLWALVSWTAGSATDAFEARRALGVFALLPLALAGGAGLGERGRRTFAALLVALSSLWTGWAIARGFAGDSFAGVLGDTGSLSQAALPGAAIACVWLAREAGAKRAAGALAAGLFLVHVAAAPVLAGSHTLLAGLGLAAWRGGPRGRGTLLALTLAALLAPFAGLAVRQMGGGGAPAIEGAPAEGSRSLGGLAVRARVWTAALGLVADHPLLGAGPGQFQAAFPPHRDPREIELSRHGVCSELDTEVEHAHNDWLQGVCELGLVGGALLALGLALAARDALCALADEERAPLALAALALLVNAFVHAPLTGNPGAGPLALAVFGALAPLEPWSRLRASLVALPALVAFPFAPALIQHGAALTEYTRSAQRIDELARGGADQGDRSETAALLVGELARARAVVELALAAAPASAPARALGARLAADGERVEERVAAWDRLLAVRPHSSEAWEQSAMACVRTGRFEEARQRLREALALSPTHPRLLKNAARLELEHGELEAGLAALGRFRQLGCDPAWSTALGNELVLDLGRPARGAPVLFGAPLDGLAGEELHARSREPGGAALAEAAECLAQLRWAREHAQSGRFDLALRNYRQAAERSHAWRGSERGPAALYALELAAAAERAGRQDEARTRMRGAVLERAAWGELPDWARATLEELGLDPPR